jgi:hypothetical protein
METIKSYAPFKKSDGNGGAVWNWNKIIEKCISGILIVAATTLFTSYTTIIKLDARIDRIESCITKMGKVFWNHTNPNTSYPFDEFRSGKEN